MGILNNKLLQAIFFLAIFLRLLYFPSDIHFGYDQARDAFISQKVLQGDFVVVGPPTTFTGLFHGGLFYYFFAPFYFLGNGNPIFLAFALRIINAAGVFLVFQIAKNLFNKKTAFIASFIYAISFEQIQFAMFLAHPSAATFTSLLFFWGMSELIFNKKNWGLVVASIGLGLSSQMHFSMLVLFPTFITLLLVFRKNLVLDKKSLLTSLFILFLLTSTFWLTELKYDFLNTKGLLNLFNIQTNTDSSLNLSSILKVITLYIRHNIFNYE